MGQLEGKVAVITGASSGIGRATAVQLAEAGAAVAVLGRKQEALDDVAAEIKAKGGRVLPRALDVRDHEAMAKLAHENFKWTTVCDNITVQYDPIGDSKQHVIRLRFSLSS